MEFLPWSKQFLTMSLKRLKTTNQLCYLDVELGGACNFRCRYCDTPRYMHEIQYDLDEIFKLAEAGKVEWIFICGLGEPTATKNINFFKRILTYCEKQHIKCSAFSNLAEFDDELFAFVEKKVLYPMFKLDSLQIETLCSIYAIPEELAQKQLFNAKKLASYAQIENGCTNICASIVPSSMNISSIRDVIDWCYENNIFPLIGDLEDAGKGQVEYQRMKLSSETLKEVLEYIRSITGRTYRIPICPSVLFGIHITHDGYVTVDDATGFSCHWFWLTEPKIKKISMIKHHTYKELSDIVLVARKDRRENVVDLMKNSQKMVFGGCGGDVVDLLGFYLDNM